ncbi:MAG: hypothetical protein IJB30_01535 [Clostridia bacterium]|nr:hypothetical protein [Clostridia bacterium]
MKGTAAYICGGNKKPNQHYYPTRLVVADAALLAAKSKGLALSLTLSLRLFREKSRFATNFSRYASLSGEAEGTLEAGGMTLCPFFRWLRFMKSRGLPLAGTAHPLLSLSSASFKGFNFPEGKIILKGRWVG